MRQSITAMLIASILVAAPAAYAHHSAARFDLTIRDHYVTGIVKEFHRRLK